MEKHVLPKPGDRVVSRRPDGLYDVGEVVTVAEEAWERPARRDNDEIIILSDGLRTIVVQFDPDGQPPADTFEQAFGIARDRRLDARVWVRHHDKIEPVTEL